MYRAYNFQKKCVLGANIYLWMESVCLCLEGKEFNIMGAAKENERFPNVFVRSLGHIKFHCQKKSVNFFWVCTQKVIQTSK